MTKYLGAFMTTLMIAAPVATVISCNTTNKSNDVKNQIEHFNDVKKKIIELNSSDKELLQDVKEGLYLTSNSYKSGQLGRGDVHTWTREENKVIPVGQWSGWSGSAQNVVEFGDGDSFFVKYDNNDQDGFTPYDFERNIWLNDTSIMHNQKTDAINERLGHSLVQGSWGKVPSLRMVFDDKTTKTGYLPAWVGSQTNHISQNFTFDQAVQKLMDGVSKGEITQKSFEAICNYYGILPHPDSSGHFPDDPSVKNGANKSFFPVFQGSKYFTFSRLSDRIFKVTFHNKKNTSTTAAIWKFTSTIINPKTKRPEKEFSYGPFSLGDEQEWSKYEKSQMKYHFSARKNIFIEGK